MRMKRPRCEHTRPLVKSVPCEFNARHGASAFGVLGDSQASFQSPFDLKRRHILKMLPRAPHLQPQKIPIKLVCVGPRKSNPMLSC